MASRDLKCCFLPSPAQFVGRHLIDNAKAVRRPNSGAQARFNPTAGPSNAPTPPSHEQSETPSSTNDTSNNDHVEDDPEGLRGDLASCPILRKAVLVAPRGGEEAPLQKVNVNGVPFYLLLVRLVFSDNPTITRILSVPASLNFVQLHVVLQIAFGWESEHAYRFTINNTPDLEAPPRGNRTPVWEQDLMKMTDRGIGLNFSTCAERNAADVKLFDVFDKPEWRDKAVRAVYTYDFGDNWDHEIVFLGVSHPNLMKAFGFHMPKLPEKPYILCLSGEGRSCVEDCGGPHGWDQLKELFAKKDRPDPDNRRRWYRDVTGKRIFDPWKWDIDEVNKQLGAYAKFICT